MDYETEQNLIKTNPNNFTRTLLRLHRALIFIEEFLRGLNERPSSESTAAVAATCYDATLYHHRKYQRVSNNNLLFKCTLLLFDVGVLIRSIYLSLRNRDETVKHDV